LDESLAECPGCGGDTRFSVRAPDGTLYGPYTLAQVRAYAYEGRIVPSAVIVAANGDVFGLRQAGIATPLPGALASPPAERRGMPGWAILLIVLAILVPIAAIVAAIVAPHRAMTRRLGSTGMTCRSNLQQLSMALEMYRNDYKSYFPREATWRPALYAYLYRIGWSPQALECPASGLGQRSYDLAPALSGVSDLTLAYDKRRTIPMVYDAGLTTGAGPHNGNGNVAFVDGSVKLLAPARFKQYCANWPKQTPASPKPAPPKP
jgi:prepilin-type processing-associated H-X9-DG protein